MRPFLMFLIAVLMAVVVSAVPAGSAKASTANSLSSVSHEIGGRGLLPFRRNVRSQMGPRQAVILPGAVVSPLILQSQPLLVPQQQIIVPQQQSLLFVR